MIKLKQNEKSLLINEIHNVATQVDVQHDLLSKFHQVKLELDKAREQIEICIDQRKQRYTEVITKITDETKEGNIFIITFISICVLKFILCVSRKKMLIHCYKIPEFITHLTFNNNWHGLIKK